MLNSIRKNLKRKKYKGNLAFVLCIAVLITSMGTLVACQDKSNAESSNVEIDAVASNTPSPSDEASVSPTESVGPTITPIVTPSLPATNNYSSSSVKFDYPSTWTFAENPTEDVFYVNFFDTNSETEPVFWYSQGESWLTDLERTEEDYKAILSESYPDIAITALTKTTIGGYDAIKLVFNYTSQDKKYIMTQYETIVGYASFRFNYTYSTEIKDDYESIFEPVISSIEFTN